MAEPVGAADQARGSEKYRAIGAMQCRAPGDFRSVSKRLSEKTMERMGVGLLLYRHRLRAVLCRAGTDGDGGIRGAWIEIAGAGRCSFHSPRRPNGLL